MFTDLTSNPPSRRGTLLPNIHLSKAQSRLHLGVDAISRSARAREFSMSAPSTPAFSHTPVPIIIELPTRPTYKSRFPGLTSDRPIPTPGNPGLLGIAGKGRHGHPELDWTGLDWAASARGVWNWLACIVCRVVGGLSDPHSTQPWISPAQHDREVA